MYLYAKLEFGFNGFDMRDSVFHCNDTPLHAAARMDDVVAFEALFERMYRRCKEVEEDGKGRVFTRKELDVIMLRTRRNFNGTGKTVLEEVAPSQSRVKAFLVMRGYMLIGF